MEARNSWCKRRIILEVTLCSEEEESAMIIIVFSQILSGLFSLLTITSLECPQ